MPSKPARNKKSKATKAPSRLAQSATPSVLLAAAGMIAASAVFVVWTHTTSLRLGYELGQANSEQTTLVRDNARLRAEVARLKSPARLSAVATKQLGLAPPTPDQVVRLRARVATADAP